MIWRDRLSPTYLLEVVHERELWNGTEWNQLENGVPFHDLPHVNSREICSNLLSLNCVELYEELLYVLSRVDCSLCTNLPPRLKVSRSGSYSVISSHSSRSRFHPIHDTIASNHRYVCATVDRSRYSAHKVPTYRARRANHSVSDFPSRRNFRVHR